MDSKTIVLKRMASQGFGEPGFSDVVSLVGWMGCVQAQDFAQAKWGVGLRLGVSDARIEEDFNAGSILRTHVLRPTWHFVLPEDIGWMLRLSAPRIRAFSKPYYRQLGLDAAIFRRARKVIGKALSEDAFLTRADLVVHFKQAKINTDDIRMNFLMMDAELDGLICSGPRKGKQFTYSLLERRVERSLEFNGDEALGELARRYFTSRGPATLPDFAWWGGLTLGQARRGLEEVKDGLVNEGEYWFGDLAALPALGTPALLSSPQVLLLPGFDELTVAYKDRTDFLLAAFEKESSYGLKPVIMVNGRIAGVWRRVVGKGKVVVEVKLFEKVSKAVGRLISREAKRYAGFVGEKVVEVR